MKLIFGAIYVLILIVFAIHFYLNIFSLIFSILLSIYLIGKGIVSGLMKSSLLSFLDSVAGFYFLLLSLAVFPNNIFTVVFLLYLVQKGITYIYRGFYEWLQTKQFDFQIAVVNFD